MSRQLTAVLMLIAYGLYIAVLWTFSIERVWIWRGMDLHAFAVDFGKSVRRVDIFQPALAVLSLLLAVGYVTTVGGTSRILTVVAVVLMVVVFIGSVFVGVPMQKPFRFAEQGDVATDVDVANVRERWTRFHLVRTVLSVVAFVLLVVAAVYP